MAKKKKETEEVVEEPKKVTKEVTEKPKKEKTTKDDEIKEAVANALKEKDEELKANKKKKRKRIRRIILALLLIAILIFIFFFLKFKVTFKYNNGEEDKIIKVKFLRKIPPTEVRDDLEYPGYKFVGYFETYYLSGEQIDSIKNDATKEKDICKEGFALDSEKVKCVAEKEFDFNGTRKIWKKTIEALWEKEKETPKPTPKPQPKPTPKPKPTKDNGTISLALSNSCVVNGSSVTVTATVKNAKDSTINWSSDSCLSLSGSGNSRTVTAKNCGSNPTITAKLNNGATDTIKLTFEKTLSVTVIDYENKTDSYSDGYYWGVRTIKTNIPAVITGSVTNKSDAARTEASANPSADGTIKVKTACGQSKTLNLKAVIN